MSLNPVKHRGECKGNVLDAIDRGRDEIAFKDAREVGRHTENEGRYYTIHIKGTFHRKNQTKTRHTKDK